MRTRMRKWQSLGESDFIYVYIFAGANFSRAIYTFIITHRFDLTQHRTKH